MPFSTDTCRRLIWISVFAVAMAQLEAAVVAYLRELYYPEGFHFPLVVLRNRIAVIEIGREVATVLMLVGIAMVSSRDPWRRFAVFLLSFGLWDIFYYVWLRVMLGWPESLLTSDILFLIPLPWEGPVLAPTLVAAVMVAAALGIEGLRDAGRPIPVRPWEWGAVVACAVGLVVIFMREAPALLDGGVPGRFPWLVFLALLALAVVFTLGIYRRARGAPSAS